MDIKLPIAINTVDGRLLHVGDRVPAGAALVCPFCSHPVKKNAGSTRRHHFVHMPGANCSVSYETLLHEGAKVYLHRCLERGDSVEILIYTGALRPSKTRSMLESLGVQRFSSSSKAVFKNGKANHFLERVVAGKVKPDIVSLGEYSAGGERDVFAWEIFVTHEVEEEKANQLRLNGIPYIELSPIEDGASTYLYTMKSYGGISFIDDDTIFNETIFRDNKADIVAAFRNKMNEEILKEKLEDARQSWKAAAAKTMQRGLERQMMLKVKDMTPADVIAFAQAMSTAPLVIVPITSAPPDGNSTSDDNWVKVQTVSCEKHNQNYFVKVNDRHYFISGLGMLRGLYAGLARMGILLGVTARNERLNETVLVGAKLTLPLLERKVFEVCSSLLYQYVDAPTVEVYIWETRSIKSKTSGRHHMLVNDGILVDSYEWQLKNILYHLLRFTTVEAHLGLNTEGRPRVDALKIWGLMDVERMKEAILAAMNLSSK